MNYDIVSLGEILIDFVPDGADECSDSRFIAKAGGAPLNLLATAARFGLKTTFIGKVGNDMFGRILLSTLEKNGIDSAVSVDDVHNTTLAFVRLDENGDRDFSFYRNFGADVFLEKRDIDLEKVKHSRLFHFGSLSFTSEPSKSAAEFAVKYAKKCGCIISYDPNYREPLWKSRKEAINQMKDNLKFADIVKLSKDEAQMITGETDVYRSINKLYEYGITAIIVTDAANDITFSVGGQTKTVKAEKVKAVDTTGAGDIFFGSFLSAFLLDNISLDDLNSDLMGKYIESAKKIAAVSVTRKGAIASIPENPMKDINK